MSVTKIIGYFLVMAGCSGLGVWYSRQMQSRILHIKEMIRILDMINSEITFRQSTLPECCDYVREKSDEPYCGMFGKIFENMCSDTGIGFDTICRACLTEGLEKLPLKEERELFIKCLSDVGFCDSWMQNKNIERGKMQLQGILDREETDIKKQSKLALSLGTMCGVLLVLILL